MGKNTKAKLPEKNVEYTIAFSGKIYKYVLIDITDSGRIIFQNTKTNHVTPMSIDFFNIIRNRNQIIKERKLDEYVSMPTPIKFVKPSEGEQYWQYVIKRIRSTPETLNASVVSLIGYLPSKLADEMDNLEKGGYTKEYEYRVMRNVKLVVALLDKYDLEPEEKDLAEKARIKQLSTQTTMHRNERCSSERISVKTLIKLLTSISPSMLMKCKAHFGYPVAELIGKLNKLDNKDEPYIESLYKEADRIFVFVGYKTAMA